MGRELDPNTQPEFVEIQEDACGKWDPGRKGMLSVSIDVGRWPSSMHHSCRYVMNVTCPVQRKTMLMAWPKCCIWGCLGIQWTLYLTNFIQWAGDRDMQWLSKEKVLHFVSEDDTSFDLSAYCWVGNFFCPLGKEEKETAEPGCRKWFDA